MLYGKFFLMTLIVFFLGYDGAKAAACVSAKVPAKVESSVPVLHERYVSSSDRHAQVHVASVEKVMELGTAEEVKINMVVVDLGPSTDLSPTKKVYFTLYNKGEMFSTDAAFDIGNYMAVISAVKKDDYRFALEVTNVRKDGLGIIKEQYIINANTAIKAIQNVRCEQFDCEKSANFKGSIILQKNQSNKL
ncbi:hypothetical protein [Marinagarivorans algicola]|uniref:hypothetical protein n=1 Tax=Marinagarivorans algicola TaxID=1513270 RepID=UPI003736D33A